MRRGVHLADSPEPLAEKTTITAKCGVEVTKAIWVAFADGDFIYISDWLAQIRGKCTNCDSKSFDLDQRYVYALTEETTKEARYVEAQRAAEERETT